MAEKKFTEALADNTEIQLTVRGRKTQREIETPVWFVQENGSLYLLPVRGSDSNWFKNLRHTPTIRIAVNGTSLDATAQPISEVGKVRDVVKKFRNKYSPDQIANYYSKLDVAVEVPLV